MESFLNTINAVIWGIPALMLILSTGIYLSAKTGFAQIRLIPKAFMQLVRSIQRKDMQKISGYRSLCTALAATVGTGNIAGVAGAIAIGGPGTIFWMWLCALLGMVIKCAEVVLAIHFRQENCAGEHVGGPMYTIQNGLPKSFHILAVLYCIFGVVASMGVGNATQVNTVIAGMKDIASYFQVSFGKTDAFLLGVLIIIVIIPLFRKGSVGIGKAAAMLVPFAAITYIILATMVLCKQYRQIPEAFLSIFHGAFSQKSICGGLIGSFWITLRTGLSRGIFTNEAGMGTASIAHSSANLQHPMEQGLMGIMEVFLDTIVICTLTGLVILCSGVQIQYGTDPGISLTLSAFSSSLGNWSRIVLTVLTSIFAFATVLGWGLYGMRCWEYLFGNMSTGLYMIIQCVSIILGCILQTSVVWVLSEIVNGLMAIPNLIALIALSPIFLIRLKEYRKAYNP